MSHGAQFRRWIDDARQGDWSIRSLRGRCAALADFLLARSTPLAVIEAAWPGGEDNDDARGLGAWIIAFAKLHALVRASDQAAAQVVTDPTVLRRVVARSLADRPEPVTLSDGTRVAVYPKSYAALEELDALDAAIGVLGALDVASAQFAGTLTAATALRSLGVRVWVWIVTHDQPGLPYAPGDVDPVPPAWTESIAPEDVVALTVAHRRVHAQRLQLMGAAFPRDKAKGEDSRLKFEGFLGTYAATKPHDPLEVMTRWSLGRVIAAAVSEADTAQTARARAEAEAAARRPPTGAPAGRSALDDVTVATND